MKAFIHLVILFSLSFASYSQEYQCIRNVGEQFFTNGENYRAIKIDSVLDYSDHKSYYNFYVIGTTDPWECYSNEHPSWIGYRVDEYENGDHYFFNVAGDSILIKSSSEVDDEWVSYTFGNGDYVRGKVVTKEEIDFLGQTDSVKTIQFNALNSYGNPVASSINNKKIMISKSWGMIQALNFKLFPDLYDYPYYEYINEYELCGMSQPQSGIQNLTIENIFDFEVDDELHIHQFASSWLQNHYFYYEIHRVLDKEWISDSVINYSFEHCIRRLYIDSDTLILSHDTSSVSVNIKVHEDPGLNEVPDKTLSSDIIWEMAYYWYLQFMYDEPVKMCKFQQAGYYYDEQMDCIVPLIDYENNAYFLEGLGGPYWNYGSFGSENYRGLVYYKKGDDEWGDPYSCDSLLVEISTNKPGSEKVIIAPNPMTEVTNFSFVNKTGETCRLMLYDSFGYEVRRMSTQGDNFIIRKAQLPAGIYFYSLFSEDQIISSGKLIIQ